MKIRQILAVMLTALLLLALLIGCEEDVFTEDGINSALPNSEKVPVEDFAGVVGEYLTCVVTDLMDENAVDVEVCNDLFGKYSASVRIVMDGLNEMNIAVGDELRVKVDSIVVGNDVALKVNAQTVQIIALGDGHKTDGETAVYKNGDQEFGPYPILALSEISVNPSIPSAQVLKDKSYEVGIQFTMFNSLLRVVEVREDIVYLANINNIQANYVLVGLPEASFSVGDHVQLFVAKHVSLQQDAQVKIFYAEDLVEFSVADEQTVAKAYFNEMIAVPEKPVIYLYPEEETTCSVKVNIDGKLTCTYPEHGDAGWQSFTAKPDGTLIFDDGSEYYCLYWEGVANMTLDFSKGFCVKGSETAEFFAKILPEIGLTSREANEFIIYWLPELQNNAYNLISFQGENYTNAAELEITPTPDSLLRIYMTAKPLDAPVEIEPQTFAPFERKGFTVVEWGGSIIK